MIIRPLYQQQINNLLDKPLIKVLIWQRRVGKSTLLKSVIVQFDHCIVIDKEQKIYDMIYDSDTLYHHLKSNITRQTQIIAVDEIQNIIWWETAILSIYSEYPQIQIRITGSNSNMLSSELTTRLRWRYLHITVYPFVYSEYCEYHKQDVWVTSMQQYIAQWSMPSVYPLLALENSKQWRKDLINTIVIKDIVQRYNIRDVDFVYDVYMFLLNNIGNITNTVSLVNYIKSLGKTVAHQTLQQYISYLCDAFLIYECGLYDIQGKRIFERLRKYYVSDASMRGLYFGWYDGFVGKNIENIVYMTARAYGRELYVGRIREIEVDFVLIKNGKTMYLQVAYLLADEQVIHREYTSLQQIQDSRPKYVVSMDTITMGVVDGIQHIHLWELEEILA